MICSRIPLRPAPGSDLIGVLDSLEDPFGSTLVGQWFVSCSYTRSLRKELVPESAPVERTLSEYGRYRDHLTLKIITVRSQTMP